MLWTLLSVASRTAAAKAQLRTLTPTPTPTPTLTANLNPTQAQLRVVTMNIHAWRDSEHRLNSKLTRPGPPYCTYGLH